MKSYKEVRYNPARRGMTDMNGTKYCTLTVFPTIVHYTIKICWKSIEHMQYVKKQRHLFKRWITFNVFAFITSQ